MMRRNIHATPPRRPGVDHTPTTPAGDDRPIRILDRADVPEAHKERLIRLVRRAQAIADTAGRELQSEFGRMHVSLIVGCNQFLRLFRDETGEVELLVGDKVKQLLGEAGFTLKEPDGAIFKMFGWVRLDPMEGDLDRLEEAVEAAFQDAVKKDRPSG